MYVKKKQHLLKKWKIGNQKLKDLQKKQFLKKAVAKNATAF